MESHEPCSPVRTYSPRARRSQHTLAMAFLVVDKVHKLSTGLETELGLVDWYRSPSIHPSSISRTCSIG